LTPTGKRSSTSTQSATAAPTSGPLLLINHSNEQAWGNCIWKRWRAMVSRIWLNLEFPNGYIAATDTFWSVSDFDKQHSQLPFLSDVLWLTMTRALCLLVTSKLLEVNSMTLHVLPGGTATGIHTTQRNDSQFLICSSLVGSLANVVCKSWNAQLQACMVQTIQWWLSRTNAAYAPDEMQQEHYDFNHSEEQMVPRVISVDSTPSESASIFVLLSHTSPLGP
jgi:hypothetical protein